MPINKKILTIEPVTSSITDEDTAETPSQLALKAYLQRINSELDEKTKNMDLKSAAFANSQVLRSLTALCRTTDQATAVYSMLDIITEKTRQTTVSVNASRGRVGELERFNCRANLHLSVLQLLEPLGLDTAVFSLQHRLQRIYRLSLSL